MCPYEMLDILSLRKHAAVHVKTDSAPRVSLVPYDKCFMLQQVVESILYLAVEFRCLHPFARCRVLISRLHP